MATQGSKSNFQLPKELSLDFCRIITNNFSDERKLSESPFGTLYKGNRDDGTAVVVKRLHEHPELPADSTFNKEVQHLMALKHENIVGLVGFCSEVQMKVMETDGIYMDEVVSECLLCYEYFPNGSLEDYLFGTKAAEHSSLSEPNIDWGTRFKIVKGICQGLLFLHNLSRPIIHMDINNKSIWLGENMVPKLGNFGLSRLIGYEKTRTNTQTVVGSYGYMAPEYLYEGEISAKADIYSLGLTIMEICTTEKNIPGNLPSGRGYIDKIRREWTAEHISSRYRSYDGQSLQQVYECIKVGLECAQLDRNKRPRIVDIVHRLNRI